MTALSDACEAGVVVDGSYSGKPGMTASVASRLAEPVQRSGCEDSHRPSELRTSDEFVGSERAYHGGLCADPAATACIVLQASIRLERCLSGPQSSFRWLLAASALG
jgi:hypothetical protein